MRHTPRARPHAPEPVHVGALASRRVASGMNVVKKTHGRWRIGRASLVASAGMRSTCRPGSPFWRYTRAGKGPRFLRVLRRILPWPVVRARRILLSLVGNSRFGWSGASTRLRGRSLRGRGSGMSPGLPIRLVNSSVVNPSKLAVSGEARGGWWVSEGELGCASWKEREEEDEAKSVSEPILFPVPGAFGPDPAGVGTVRPELRSISLCRTLPDDPGPRRP